MDDFKYYLVILNKECYDCLHKDIGKLIAVIAKKGKELTLGDCLVGRDILLEGGFKWGKDFYIKKDIK